MLGSILIISGPSGVGKSSLCKEMFKEVDNSFFSISTTTRGIRAGEQNGVDYHFVPKEQFESDIENSKFLEWAKVHNNYYGTSIASVKNAIDKGKLIVFDIDVQGFELVLKSEFREFCTSVFIAPPSIGVLEKRLLNRATDSKEVIDNRVKNAKDEIAYIPKYDFLIVNDDLDKASLDLITIAKSAKLKPKSYNLKSLSSSI